MEKLNVAIVDDDPDFLAAMCLTVKSCCGELGLAYAVAPFPDAESFLAAFTPGGFHIVLLDIMLPRDNGISLARAVYQASPDTVIAFMTVSPDFALEGYGVNAVRYLLKPVTPADVRELMGNSLERLNRPEKHVLLKAGRIVRHIRPSSILYLESDNKQVHVHCDEETLCCQAKLGDLLHGMPDGFLQVHKSYAVNLARASGLSPEAVMLDNGRGVPVSRRFRASTAAAYFAFVAAGV